MTGVSDPTKSDAELARRLQRQENERASAARIGGTAVGPAAGASTRGQPSWTTAGAGRSLGGSPEGQSAEERRQRALEAAERRQVEVPGVSKQKAVELRERQQRDDYLGKLAEHYKKKRMDMPMGLNMASLEQLRQHWDQVRQGDTASAQLLNHA
eukprot:CAMPEP_0171096770 /NCGR_PEP_ID=MMETSP0766_2-20121228/45868_1 /TAXON_ID=439317 /ORGANISM="Gambierdiscus australes, Strain CAWD 149" /LENGTH=154 /DNA_ID=CAMNT_0011555825 /DNA_START=74 /DNA_END=538 /DNA_ORIENTATION=-